MSTINKDTTIDKEIKDGTVNGNQHIDMNSAIQQTSDNAEVDLLEKENCKSNLSKAASLDEKELDERETWGKKIDFLLSVIGFAVDLANVWRFPYLCYKNGGGAFLIPYVSMLIIGGVPLFYMELALGQYIRQGAITCWAKICPLLKGIGFCVVMIAFYTDFFYNVLITWSLYYFYKSFAFNLPWTSCNNDWNTKFCRDDYLSESFNSSLHNSSWDTSLSPNMTNTTVMKVTYPADEFYRFAVLGREEGITIENLGQIQVHLAVCLLAVYIICYFSLWKGISMSGKVVWFTAVFPYVVLLILFFRGITLKGAMTGVYNYLVPNMEIFRTPEPWVDAATQVFFSLGPGFGVLLAFASYNKFHNNVYKDALFTSAVNSCTSFLSGFVVFSVLGYMAHKRQVKFVDVISADPGLVFTVYPEALSTLPGSTFWSLIFFLMLLTLGLDSSFGGSEAVVTAFSDEFPIVKRRREIFLLLLFIFYYMIGLLEVTQGGMFIFLLFEKYCVNYSILIAVLFETLCISWIYGVDRFRGNIKEMVGFLPGNYWKFCWKFIAPIFILLNIVFGLANHENLSMDDYKYPRWVDCIGWALAASSVFFIPVTAVVQLARTKGTLRQRLRILVTPQTDSQSTKSPANQNNEMALILKIPSDDCAPTEDEL